MWNPWGGEYEIRTGKSTAQERDENRRNKSNQHLN
jgi:hypothetical protein